MPQVFYKDAKNVNLELAKGISSDIYQIHMKLDKLYFFLSLPQLPRCSAIRFILNFNILFGMGYVLPWT